MPRAVGSGQVLCCKHTWGAMTSVGAWASPLLGRSPTLPSSIAFARACIKGKAGFFSGCGPRVRCSWKSAVHEKAEQVGQWIAG